MPRRLVNQHFIGDLVPCCCNCLEILEPTYPPPSASALASPCCPRLTAADCGAAGTFEAVELYQSAGSNATARRVSARRAAVRSPVTDSSRSTDKLEDATAMRSGSAHCRNCACSALLQACWSARRNH